MIIFNLVTFVTFFRCPPSIFGNIQSGQNSSRFVGEFVSLSVTGLVTVIAVCVRRDGRRRSCAKYFSCASSCSFPQTRASCGFMFLNAYEIPLRPLRKKLRNHT